MANDPSNFMKDVLAAPMGDLIASIGSGVADAQTALDASSLEATLNIYSEGGDDMIQFLRDIGYQPTFYVLPETECEATISIALSQALTTPASGSVSSPASTGLNKSLARSRVYAAPVNASMANRYNYNANASATLKFKIVPVPPPGEVTEIRVAPDIETKTLAEAEVLLGQLGLSFFTEAVEPEGTDVILTQEPEGGTVMRSGDVITLTFAP